MLSGKKWELNIKCFMGSNLEKYAGEGKCFFVMCRSMSTTEVASYYGCVDVLQDTERLWGINMQLMAKCRRQGFFESLWRGLYFLKCMANDLIFRVTKFQRNLNIQPNPGYWKSGCGEENLGLWDMRPVICKDAPDEETDFSIYPGFSKLVQGTTFYNNN